MKTSSFKFFFTAFLILSLLDSCTSTKRQYNKGFQIEWFGGGSKKSQAKNRTQQHGVFSNKKLALSNTAAERHYAPLATQESGYYRLETTKQLLERIKTNSYTYKSKKEILKDSAQIQAEFLPSLLEKTNYKNQQTNESKSSRGIGLFLLLLGIIILLFASILLGALLAILGIVLMTRSPKESGSPSKDSEDNTSYIDVLYLKNGSIIRGQIIEQVPNKSLKIQTAGGSIFVYKMEEVEKIIKEPK
ncbi:MAG: hypothetical protein COA58_08785 [Bacteroidetes bacterium]|nr:MAG: hypothetical protein COA58_08785 [Bacteroidota bacterium]